MKKLAGILALLVMVFSLPNAYAFDFGGYTGPITLKFSGFMNGTVYTFDGDGNPIPALDPNREDAWGVGRVQQIFAGTTGSGTAIWNNGDGGEEITYYYYGINDRSVTALSTSTEQILSNSGTFDFYLNTVGTADMLASNRNFGGFDFYTVTGGTKFARLNLTPGILAGDNLTTIEQTLSLTTQGVNGFGSALASFDLTGDWNTSWANILNNNTFVNGTDMTLGFTVSPNSISNGFLYSHDDPGHTVVTPEPISTVLFLIGGATLAVRRIRKNRKK